MQNNIAIQRFYDVWMYLCLYVCRYVYIRSKGQLTLLQRFPRRMSRKVWFPVSGCFDLDPGHEWLRNYVGCVDY